MNSSIIIFFIFFTHHNLCHPKVTAPDVLVQDRAWRQTKTMTCSVWSRLLVTRPRPCPTKTEVCASGDDEVQSGICTDPHIIPLGLSIFRSLHPVGGTGQQVPLLTAGCRGDYFAHSHLSRLPQNDFPFVLVWSPNFRYISWWFLLLKLLNSRCFSVERCRINSLMDSHFIRMLYTHSIYMLYTHFILMLYTFQILLYVLFCERCLCVGLRARAFNWRARQVCIWRRWDLVQVWVRDLSGFYFRKNLQRNSWLRSSSGVFVQKQVGGYTHGPLSSGMGPSNQPIDLSNFFFLRFFLSFSNTQIHKYIYTL